MAGKHRESVYSVWVTGECNNDCLFCDAHPGTPGPSLPEIRERMALAREKGFWMLGFMGGEPTLRDDFVSLVSTARRMGFGGVHVNTNGRRFGDLGFALAAVRAGLTNVDFTLYSNRPGVHDSITRRVGSWRETVAGITNMVSIARALKSRPGHRGVSVSSVVVVSSKNIDHLSSVVSFLLSLGVERVTLRGCVPTKSAISSGAVPVYSRHAEEIKRALSVSDRVYTSGIPLCVSGGVERSEEGEDRDLLIEEWGKRIIERKREVLDAKVYKRECSSCSLMGVCPGFHRESPNMEVEGVWPVKAKD